jgi:tRNA(Ile2) C34 agmatinyltransferase TiaS
MSAQDPTTPLTFSREEIREIRKMLRDWQENPVCPRCGRHLTVVGPESVPGDEPDIWHVTCKPCRRAAFVAGQARDEGT